MHLAYQVKDIEKTGLINGLALKIYIQKANPKCEVDIGTLGTSSETEYPPDGKLIE